MSVIQLSGLFFRERGFDDGEMLDEVVDRICEREKIALVVITGGVLRRAKAYELWTMQRVKRIIGKLVEKSCVVVVGDERDDLEALEMFCERIGSVLVDGDGVVGESEVERKFLGGGGGFQKSDFQDEVVDSKNRISKMRWWIPKSDFLFSGL